MKAGKILMKIQMSDIFIVDIGWGNLRYFSSKENYHEGEVVLYKEQAYDISLDDDISLDFDEDVFDMLFDDDANKFNATRKEWLNNIDGTDKEIDSNEIIVICRFDDCDYLGNIRYDTWPKFEKSNIAMGRKDTFVYWKLFENGTNSYCGPMETFDSISNALLFSLYAERRFPYPNEKDWLNAYAYAKRKVTKLDILKMIEDLKVEVHNNSWTRRGSDNVLFSHSSFLYPYEYHYSYLSDKYLDAIFPKYEESLYSSKDDEIEYINPKYEKWEVIRMPDGTNKIKDAKYDGLELETFCAIKTKELQQIAYKNYETYNIDEHINYIAYNHINWYCIHDEDELFQKMKGIASVAWGFKHNNLTNIITKNNYKNLVENNNVRHIIPDLSDD